MLLPMTSPDPKENTTLTYAINHTSFAHSKRGDLINQGYKEK